MGRKSSFRPWAVRSNGRINTMKPLSAPVMSVGRLEQRGRKKPDTRFYSVLEIQTSEQTQAVVRRLGAKAHAGTPAEAVGFAEFIVLTTPWNAAEAAIRSMGDLTGKILLDAINPVAMGTDGLWSRNRSQQFGRREGTGMGHRRLGIQNTQYHRFRQYGRSSLSRR